jgi:hypothetical protein
MGTTIVELAKDEDLMVVFSTFTDELIYAGDDEKDLIEYLYEIDDIKRDRLEKQPGNKPEDRIARAKDVGKPERASTSPFGFLPAGSTPHMFVPQSPWWPERP